MGKPREDLARLLAVRKITNTELATATGCSRQTVYNLCEGRTDVMTDTLAKFATALKVPIQRVLMAFRVSRLNNRRSLVGDRAAARG